eukprot:TRINITY_DN4509_c0_g1_i1.p1 TRINITY_DN4509_c0_g1~~TRINITY_DN4509_c0_g1_i1.p1  ORF type:complete len:688 (-),score=174.07 TRINITY_DN4509_c0_g1_i1:97-2139(-)
MAAFAKNVMLAETWDEKTTDPKGWWISEKLDGVRAYWNGTTFYSRNGNTFEAPAWFKAKLPNSTPLDGELWCGRGLFQKCVGIAKKKLRPQDNDPNTSDWRFVSYCVFDAPHVKGDFETRYNFLKTIIKSSHSPACVLVGVEKCVGIPDLRKKLDEVEAVGGEGLMLRKPHSPYQQGRCDLLLKVKTFHDEEAKVIGYQYKEGSTSVIRHLRCILPNGIDFSIGTGFSNAERANPPKIGAVVTFKYQSLSDEGKPRFPAYLRERNDITWKDVLNNANQKQLYSNQDKIKEELKEHGEKEKKAGLLFTKSYSSSLLLQDAPAAMFASPVKFTKPAAKIIDDDDSSAPAASSSSSSKPVCKYGPACYRKNEDHLEQFSHPWADAESAPAPAPASKPAKKHVPAPQPVPVVVEASPNFDDPGDVTYMPPQPKKTKKQQAEEAAILALNRPSCGYGAGCYRKNPQHRKDEAHPGDIDWVDPTLGPVTRSNGAPSAPAPAPAPAHAAPKPAAHVVAPKAAIVDDDAEAGDAPEEDESTNSDNRPVCRYGSSCYRTNPDHLKKFRHYWESKPAANKSKPAAGSSSSSSSKPTTHIDAPAVDDGDDIIIDDTASLEALEDDLLVDDDVDLLHVSPVKHAPKPSNYHSSSSSSDTAGAQKKRPNLIVDDDDEDDSHSAAPPAKRPKFE